MEIAIADLTPIIELDPELKGRLRLPHELGFVDAEQVVERSDRRDRALAHADRSDRIGLNQGNLGQAAERLAQRGSGHPAGSAAARNHNSAKRPAAHLERLLRRKARRRPALSLSSGSSMPRLPSGRCAAAPAPPEKT